MAFEGVHDGARGRLWVRQHGQGPAQRRQVAHALDVATSQSEPRGPPRPDVAVLPQPRDESIHGVRVYPGFTKMVVDAEPASWMEADGELIGVAARAVFTVVPSALRLVL